MGKHYKYEANHFLKMFPDKGYFYWVKTFNGESDSSGITDYSGVGIVWSTTTGTL